MAARQLKARKPDAGKITRPKIIVFGPPNTNKTRTALCFPRAYFIDTEGGASLPQYQKALDGSGGVYFGKDEGSQDFSTVIAEIQTLATVKHDYLTLVIDSFSKLYNIAAAMAETRVGNDYGKDKKEAQKPTRQLMLWLERLDMNVLLICHAKEKWARQGNNLYSEGQTFDGWEKMEYDLHLVLQTDRHGMATVCKTRLDGFPRDEVFPWTFKEFEKRAGKEIMLRPNKPVVLAGEEELRELRRLLGIVKLSEDWEEKALAKAGVNAWEEMEMDKVEACIKHLSGMVKPLGSADDAA